MTAPKSTQSELSADKVLKYLSYFIILTGVILRLCIYFQNRNLFIDEANVARNIYERDFSHLLLPLSYMQYAPPLYLWSVKLVTSVIGYSEYVLRLISLLSGIGSLVLLYLLLQKYNVRKAAWYPLFILSVGLIYLRYATELKQYGLDSFIALGLVYMAVQIDAKRKSLVGFACIWACAGSVAIWSSMPSVFILAGVGVYYFVLFYHTKEYKRIYALSTFVLIWVLQFVYYYFIILKPQVQSDYLQNFHKSDFLFLLPRTTDELLHNWNLIAMNVLGQAAGHWVLSLVFHLAAISVGMYYAVRQRSWIVLLLVVPIILVLFTASLHQYSLQPRLVLFIMPQLLILIGMGLEQIIGHRYVRIAAVVVAMICMYNFSQLKYLSEPMRTQEITKSMQYLKEKQINGPQLYVNFTAVPAFVYYTTIHPDSARWSGLKGASLLGDPDFDSLSQTMKGRTALLYSYDEGSTMDYQQAQINRHLKTVDHYTATLSQVFIYQSPE